MQHPSRFFLATIALAALQLISAMSKSSEIISSASTTIPGSCHDVIIDYKRVWKTVEIGHFKNFFHLRNALYEAGIAVGDKADEIMARPSFQTSSSKIKFDLTVYSANDLGLREAEVSQSTNLRTGTMSWTRALHYGNCTSVTLALS